MPWGMILICLAGAIVERLVWLGATGGILAERSVGEAARVARSIAGGGGFADAFFAGQGPTAHLLPLPPLVAGGLFTLLGIDSPAATLVLIAWSLAQSLGSFLLLALLWQRLGASRGTLVSTIALLALCPVFAAQDALDFRYWEGGLAACLGAMNLLLLERFWRTPPSTRALLGVAGLTALTFFVSPPVGLAVDACWALFALNTLPVKRSISFAGSAAAALTLFLVPWALRNQAQFGTPILLRSNFGLEIALASHPGALAGEDPELRFERRLHAIHPYHGAAPAFQAAGGEVAYAEALGRDTRRWIATHPGAFARLCLRHLREFFFPRPWQWNYSDWIRLQEPRAWITGVINALGLLGLAIGVVRRRRFHAMLALYVALVAAPYAIVQPIPRYTYLVYPLLAFAAFDLLAWISRLARDGRDRRAAAPRDAL
jgi:uncharacterized membrane protein